MNFIKRLFSRKPRTDQIYVQLTPIPFDVVETTEEPLPGGVIGYPRRVRSYTEMGDEADKVVRFIVGEKKALAKWSGVPVDQVEGDPVYPGFQTGFCILCAFPEGIEEDVDTHYPKASAFIADLFSYTVLGDQGTYIGNQKFDKRCRWTLPLK